MRKIKWLVLASLLIHATAQGATVEQIGTGHNWDSVTWQAIGGLNDGNDGIAAAADFVGDSYNPGAYWADDGQYVYFRMQVATPTATLGSFNNSYMVLINVAGYDSPGTGTNTNGSLPDFAFAWDSKSNNAATHGLEMSVLSTKSDTWNGISMNDLDGAAGSKGSVDINGGGRSTDGYVRTVDSQSTTNFGTTTFIDFCVSKAYISTVPNLTSGSWSIGFASIVNQTDHNILNGDIAGANITDPTTIGFTTIPEPSVAMLFSSVCLLLLLGIRQRNRC